MSHPIRMLRIIRLWSSGFILAVLAFGVSSLISVANASGPTWIHDFSEGKRVANSTKKDLVVVFTGRGWCQPCELLDQNVFQDARFAKATADDFVFVELDFNFGDTNEEKDRETKYRQLKDEYLVPGYPTIVLMDPHGLPFATIVGYSKDVGPERMAEQLKSARTAKDVRDDFFRKAESSVDERERVIHLHEGIQSVASLFGSLEQHGDDAVLAFYRKQVDEILGSSHDAEKAIRSIYIERSKTRDAWLEVQASKETRDETLRKFVSAKDYRGAIDYLDSILGDIDDADLYWQLQLTRQRYLEADGDYEGAIRNAQQLLKSEDVPERIRESILDSEARSLAFSKRGSEAIAHYDRRIEASAADSKKKLRLLYRKARLLEHTGSTQEAIRAWKAYRDFAKPNSFEWLTGTAQLARGLQKSGEYQEALSLFEQILSTLAAARGGEVELAWPWSPDRGQFIMLEAAECHIALGESSDAKALIDQAAADINALRKSPRRGDNQRAKQLQEKVTALRSTLDDNTRENAN